MKKLCLGWCGKLIPYDPRNPGKRLCPRCRETKAKRILTLSKNEENQNQVKVME